MSRVTEFKRWRQHADECGFITHVERTSFGNQKIFVGYVNGEIVCNYRTRRSVYRKFRKLFSKQNA